MLRAKEEPILPVSAARGRIEEALARSGALLLCAPPGTGKSTQVPRFLLDRPGQVWILQPRRIAARTLAARVAEEIGEPIGKTAGYQVRFESASGPETKLLFQTYGTFRQRALRDPLLPGVHTVVLDEFHERAWESDLALLWCRELRKGPRPDLRLVVMSATMDAAGLQSYVPEAASMAVEGKAFPVEIRHQTPRHQEPLPLQIVRALKALAAQGWSGSALVFLPGGGEIRQAADAVGSWGRTFGCAVRELHGSLSLDAQRETLRAPLQGPTVILTTNVAETSITVPGVTAVIDSGLHRVASYDPDRDLNTLYLQTLSAANAVQRAGRAGRTAPGICIRLWDSDRDKHLSPALDPEVRRVELSEAALAVHALIHRPGASDPSLWPTPPDPALWKRAREKLERVGAVEEGRLTPLGMDLLEWPAPPELARVLHDAAALPDPELHRQIAAMAALLSAGRSGGKRETSADLFAQAEELAEEKTRSTNRDALEAFRQFHRKLSAALGKGKGPYQNGSDPLRTRATRLFLPVYADRLAAREGAQSFALADGRRGLAASAPGDVNLLLALEIHESGGKDKVRQITLPLILPVECAWVEERFPAECRWETSEEFDSKQGKVLREERLRFRGMTLDRRALAGSKTGDAGELLAEQLRRGEIELPFDDEARQWVHRIRMAHRVCPDQGFPALDEDDWALIYHDLCAGKYSVNQLQGVSVSAALRDYLGPSLASFLDREAPTSVKLPQGKRSGKITYFEKSPPELSARLGDFIGMQGGFKIMMRRVEVTYDILAPNYRTVQKTRDLTSFWQNAYPEIKRELQRRYPRHPWP